MRAIRLDPCHHVSLLCLWAATLQLPIYFASIKLYSVLLKYACKTLKKNTCNYSHTFKVNRDVKIW